MARPLRIQYPGAVYYHVMTRGNNRQDIFLADEDRNTLIVRQMAMELCYRYSPLNQREIGSMFGVDYSTVSQNRSGIKKKLQNDTQLKKQFDGIEQRIFNLSKRKI